MTAVETKNSILPILKDFAQEKISVVELANRVRDVSYPSQQQAEFSGAFPDLYWLVNACEDADYNPTVNNVRQLRSDLERYFHNPIEFRSWWEKEIRRGKKVVYKYETVNLNDMK